MTRIPTLLVLLALPACGYTAGQVVGTSGVRVYVPVFENRTPRRDLERDLTRILDEGIRSRTRYSLADDGKRADLVIEGAVTDVSEGVLSERDLGRIRETSVRITVEVRVTDRRAGAPPPRTFTVSRRESFTPVKGQSIRTAEIEAMRRIADRIIDNLGREW